MRKIKILILIIFLSINILSVNASTEELERTKDNNYGVSKHWNINSNNINNVKNTPYVDADEKVYDFADILTDKEEETVYSYIKEFINKTNMDMVFVSIDMPYSSDKKNEDFAADFYDYNDFGINFENYSGVLLLRNDYEADRYYNIYTFGDAQLYFSYSRLENILDNIYSDFVSKNYVMGIETFTEMCSSYFDSGVAYEYRNSYIDENGYIRKHYKVPYFICFGVSGLVTLIVMLILVKNNKMVKKATQAKEYLRKDSINYTQSVDQFVNSTTTHYTISSSSGGGGSYSGSHSGSSGGGHSSGGGRHG